MSVIKSLWYIIRQIFRGLFWGYKTVNKGAKKLENSSFSKQLDEDIGVAITGLSREQYRAQQAQIEWENMQQLKRHQARINKVKNVSRSLSKSWRKK